jgi:hypothetical protein
MKNSKLLRIIALIMIAPTIMPFALSCASDADPAPEPDQSISESETQKSTKKKKPSSTTSSEKTTSHKLDATVNTLPDYMGKPFDHVAVDIGEGSYMNIFKDTSLEEYNSYKALLESEGYTLYTTNVIGENHFATYYNDLQIVNAMFINYTFDYGEGTEPITYNEARITVDSRSDFDLPSLEEENVYETTSAPMLTLISDSEIIWPGRMGYIYQLADGSFFVIDGGYTDGNNGTGGGVREPGISTGCKSSAPYVMNVLKEYAPDPDNIRIAAWLITHMHEDHFGAFVDLALNRDYEEDKNRITIEKVIYSTSCDENIKHTSADQIRWINVFKRSISEEGWGERIMSKTKAHPGQRFFLRDLTLTVYTSEDLLHFGARDPFAYKKYVNNTSIVTKVSFMGKEALYMADSSAASNPGVLAPIYNTSLKADILQVAHHGYADTDAGTVYKYVNPQIVFWPSCAQHFYGYEIGYMENSREYGGTKNVGFNDILFADGIKHYIHGSKNLTFTDFETWEPSVVPDELQVYDKDTWVADVNYIKDKNYK